MSVIEETNKLDNTNSEKMDDSIDDKDADMQLKTESTEAEGSQISSRGISKSRRRNRRPRKDENAPRMPLTGYIRFLNDRRESIKLENPSMNFTEVTKLLGTEWSTMPPATKQKYLDEAEKDKLKYYDQVETYHASDTYKDFLKKQEAVISAIADESTEKSPIEIPSDDEVNFVIPIFTQQFLEHNTMREAELRRLKRNIALVHESNIGFKKHIEAMSGAVEQLNTESGEQHANNLALQSHLENLKNTLIDSFTGVTIPGFDGVINSQNIEDFMKAVNEFVQKYKGENLKDIADVKERSVYKNVTTILESLSIDWQ